MSLETVKTQFKHVPEEYCVGLRYGLPLAWMGRNLDKAYLDEELERTFSDLLAKGFNVIETGGQGSGTDPDNHGFFSTHWRDQFKKLLRRCNELGIHIQLTAVMNGQPVGYLEPDSDKCENYRPKRLYATEPVKNCSGTVAELSLEGESISPKNTPVAVVAVRQEDNIWKEAKLLPLEDFSLQVEKLPDGQDIRMDSARIQIELKGNEAIKELDMSCVMTGIRGPVTDDGKPNPAAISMPGSPPRPEEQATPDGPAAAPGGMPAGGPPGYEERAILVPATHRVVLTYTGKGIELGAGHWDIIAYYELPNPYESYVPGGGFMGAPDPQSVTTITNCFTAAGAEKVIEAYEKHLFDDELRELLRKNGAGLFYDGGDGDPRCDAVTWSDGLVEKFRAYTGYDLRPYLPVIYSGYDLPGDGNARLAIEKLKVLSIMYGDFLERMSRWLETYNMSYHHQAAYSTHLETQEAMGHISVPEVESLNYMDCVGGYIASTSAARLYGHKKISCEMGATFRNPYDGRLRNLLTQINLALVSGVNQMKLHTSTFRYGESSLWPSHNIHYASLPDFNDTQPFWSEMDQIARAVNRGQLAVRRGVGKRDVIVYLRRFQEPEGAIDNCDHLLQCGYTYDYYNAEMLCALPEAQTGVMAPECGGFRAIVVEEDKLCRDGRMPTSAARAILNFAKAGVPVVVQGEVPAKTEGLHDSDEELKELWREIAATGNMKQVAAKEEIPAALRAFHVRPNLEPEHPGALISWCSEEDGVRCYFVLNQGRTYYRAYPKKADYCGMVRLKGQGGLWRVNPWTGETAAVPYDRDGKYVLFELDLRSWETAIFLLGGEEHMQKRIMRQYGDAMEITGWTLQVESWMPMYPYGTSAESPEGTMTKKELLPPVALSQLVPWKDIPGLDPSLSGVGYYTASFTWDGSFDGAELELGGNYDTARIYINGKEAVLDQLGLRADISPLLRRGANTLLVRCPTGLCNVLYSLNAIPCEMGYSEYGLLGPVLLRPWRIKKD